LQEVTWGNVLSPGKIPALSRDWRAPARQSVHMTNAAAKYLLPLAGIGACCALLRAVSAGDAPTPNAPTQDHMRQIIHTPDAPKNPLYSQAVKVGRDIYVTGMLGVDPKTNVFGATIQEQVRQSLVNCQAVLRAAGASLEDVAEVQVLLARPGDFEGLNQEYAKFFPVDPPVRSVTRLGPELANVLVSIRMHAVLPD